MDDAGRCLIDDLPTKNMAAFSTSSQTAKAMTRAYSDFLSAEMQRGSRMSPSAACGVKPLGTRDFHGFPLGVRGEHFDLKLKSPNMAKYGEMDSSAICVYGEWL